MFVNIQRHFYRGPFPFRLCPLAFAAALLAVAAVFFPASCAGAAQTGQNGGKWPVMTFTEDIEQSLEELSKFCLLHEIASSDVLWANNCEPAELVPGRQLLLPNSQADVLAIWQHQGAWKPKALVKTTSAAAANRAKGSVTGGQAAPVSRPPAASPAPVSAPVSPAAPVPSASSQNQTKTGKPEQPATVIPAVSQAPWQTAPVPVPQTGRTKTAQPAARKNTKDAKDTSDPVIILSPDGDPVSGPMRLVISGDKVEVVRLSKNAAPRTPSIADLDHVFGSAYIPDTLPKNANKKASAAGYNYNDYLYISGTSKMLWPVDGTVSSPFGKRGKRKHDGIDIPMPPGTPIRAARDGVVAATGNNSTPGFRGYGNFVLIDHGGGIKTLYAHCLKVVVSKGQRIRQGQIVANVGRTGRASTDHVHFEVRLNDKPVNPIPYLQKVRVASSRK